MFFTTAADKLQSALSVFEQAKTNAQEAIELADTKLEINRTKMHSLVLDNDSLLGVRERAQALVGSISKITG